MLLILALFVVTICCSASGQSDSDVWRCESDSQRACWAELQQMFGGLNEQQALQKLRTTHLREICSLAPEPECFRTAMAESERCTEEAQAVWYERHGWTMTVYGTGREYVCNQNVNVFDEHKICLAMASQHVGRSCRLHMGPGQHCPDSEFVDCAVNVYSNQCGAEIGQHMRTMANNILRDLGCLQKYKKYKRGDGSFLKKALGLDF